MDNIQKKVEAQSFKDSKLNALNQTMLHFYGQEKTNEKTMKMAEECAEDLKTFIRKKFRNITVKPYGSFVTGFGNKDSDIDLSLLVRNAGKKTSKEILMEVSELIEGAQATWKIECRIGAKVPIVCCMWKGLEVDISYVNSSAVKNTELLQYYCKWEPERLCALGFWVKKWAKAFDICSKSNGTLSSYTYILMVIYYLQRRSHPVLPCLHRDFDKGKSPKNFYTGVVAGWSKNTNNVAQLFLGFMKFYGGHEFKTNVIQIITKGNSERLPDEIGAAIVVRDCIERRVNIAEHVEEDKMNEIIGIIRRTRDDLSNWLEGKPVQDETLKKLFNIQ